MKKCLVLGAVTGNEEEGKRLWLTYKNSDLKNYFPTIDTPYETAQFKGTDIERASRAEELMLETDLVIADVSTPSLGAGMELGMALMLKKTVILFAREGQKVSALATGFFGEVNFYSSPEDLQKKLALIFSEKGKKQAE